MPSINEIRAKRAQVFEEAKTLADQADAEGRDFSGDEQAVWDQMNAEIDELTLEINNRERKETLDAVRANLEPSSGYAPARTPEQDFMQRFQRLMSGELRSMEVKFTTADLNEKRDLLAGSGTGANVIPTSFVRSLREHLIENSAIRQTNANVLVTSSGEDLTVPKTTAHPTATLTSEGAAITENDPTLATVTLGAFKYANLAQLSREFVQDEAVNVLDYLARFNGIALANASGAHFVSGDGSSKPRGVVTAAASGVTAAAVAAITGDELIDLIHSVVSGYRRNAFFLMNDATLAIVRKLKDGNGQYLWQPGLQQGVPDRLIGYPVVTDPNVATPAASAKSVVFGDFSGYYIRDVGSITFERSDDFAFANDLVTFRATMRTDGDLVDENAVKALTQAAA